VGTGLLRSEQQKGMNKRTTDVTGGYPNIPPSRGKRKRERRSSGKTSPQRFFMDKKKKKKHQKRQAPRKDATVNGQGKPVPLDGKKQGKPDAGHEARRLPLLPKGKTAGLLEK